jgi:hypothetical protein
MYLPNIIKKIEKSKKNIRLTLEIRVINTVK